MVAPEERKRAPPERLTDQRHAAGGGILAALYHQAGQAEAVHGAACSGSGAREGLLG